MFTTARVHVVTTAGPLETVGLSVDIFEILRTLGVTVACSIRSSSLGDHNRRVSMELSGSGQLFGLTD